MPWVSNALTRSVRLARSSAVHTLRASMIAPGHARATTDVNTAVSLSQVYSPTRPADGASGSSSSSSQSRSSSSWQRMRPPAQVTANRDNYPLPDATVLRMSSDAARDITGFADGTDGRLLIILNTGAQNIVLKHQSGNSTAANRIVANSGADLTLAANQLALLIYDVTSKRWRATEL